MSGVVPPATSPGLLTGRRPPEGILHDPAYTGRKAAKILAILRDALGPALAEAVGLDVGCAAGGITADVSTALCAMVAIDCDAEHLAHAQAGQDPTLIYVRGDAQRLPVADESVDVVVCAQVYEHVANADALVTEIYRVLAPGGVCLFSGPNRLDPIERHYGLPFLAWLPRRLADIYMRVAGRGPRYPERPLSYWGLKRLLRDFSITDYTVAMLRDPVRYQCQEEMGGALWMRRVPRSLLTLLLPLYPNYNWILRKREEAAR